MPLDKTPGEISVKTRDVVLSDYQRDHLVRQPGGDVSFGSQPYVDGSTLADQMMPVYANVQIAGRASTAKNAIGQALRDICEPVIGPPNDPTSSFGAFVVTTSAGGAPVITGDQLVEPKSQLKFQYIGTNTTVTTGAQISIGSIASGPGTQLAAGTLLQWVSPRPGMGANGTVVAQADGSGVSGGANAETDDDYRERYFAAVRDPAAAGNDAEIRDAIFDTPNISIQQAFTFPCIFGPGGNAFTFLLPPIAPGASRAPNSVELALVAQQIDSRFPADDGYLPAVPTPEPTTLVMGVTWKSSAIGWTDTVQWPPYNASDKVKVDAAGSRTSTTFRLSTTNATSAPQSGQTIGFLDLNISANGAPNAVFREKRILSVTVVSAGFSWDIVCDTTNGASDTSYTPNVGQYASPWSDSLNDLVVPTLQYFDTVGVGEMVATFPDPGRRQRRSPFDPDQWASELTNQIIIPIEQLTSVSSAELVEPETPLSPPIGAPGTLVYFLTLGDLAVFPE